MTRFPGRLFLVAIASGSSFSVACHEDRDRHSQLRVQEESDHVNAYEI